MTLGKQEPQFLFLLKQKRRPLYTLDILSSSHSLVPSSEIFCWKAHPFPRTNLNPIRKAYVCPSPGLQSAQQTRSQLCSSTAGRGRRDLSTCVPIPALRVVNWGTKRKLEASVGGGSWARALGPRPAPQPAGCPPRPTYLVTERRVPGTIINST